MNMIEVNYPTLGEGFITTYTTNNVVRFAWGARLRGDFFENELTLEYSNGGWEVYYFRNNNTLVYWRNDPTRQQHPDKSLIKECVDTLLAPQSSEIFKKVLNWRKDALKRLRVSVPRLQKEYETASKRLEFLENCDFSMICE